MVTVITAVIYGYFMSALYSLPVVLARAICKIYVKTTKWTTQGHQPLCFYKVGEVLLGERRLFSGLTEAKRHSNTDLANLLLSGTTLTKGVKCAKLK